MLVLILSSKLCPPGTNPLIRGLALRVMTSIRVSDIIQIQLLAVRKCATDTSPYVRKCAANAVPKIFSMVRSCCIYFLTLHYMTVMVPVHRLCQELKNATNLMF